MGLVSDPQHKYPQGANHHFNVNLLPTRSEEREVFGVRSISAAILPSRQDMKSIALWLHTHEYSWVVKKRKHLRGCTQAKINPFGHYTDRNLMGLGQYDSLGEYCGPHTASYVFLILGLSE